MPLASGFSPAGRLLYTEISSSLILRAVFLFCSEALWIWMLEWDLGSQGTFQVLFLCFTALWNGISDTFSKFVQVNLSLYAILGLQTVDIREVPKHWFFLLLLLKPWQLWWLCSAYLLAQDSHNILLCSACVTGALAWNADQLSSGSRDRMILQRDIRTPPLQSERRLQGHRQEVCGLKWSTDHQLLASGGNDNKV